jgi:signal transduction histidine kinase
MGLMLMNLGIVVTAASLLVVLFVVQAVRRRREDLETERVLAEKVEGTLGADGRGLEDAMILVDRSRRAGLMARLHVSGAPRQLPRSVDLAGYRIVQEALTNALEHGTAAATVTIGYQTGAVVLIVDSPVGGRPTRHSGVKRMRERATPVGGTVQAGPHRGGWRVQAYLPTELNPS